MKIAYRRCSTNEDKQDVGRQLFNMEFDKEFTEYASGRSESGRPIFQECLEFVSSGSELWFQDLSRAGRNALELQSTVESLINRGVKVVFVSEGLTFVGEGGDPMAQAVSKMMLAMLAAVNELFLTQTSVAVKQGLKRAVALGKKLGGSNEKHKASFKANRAKGLHKVNRSVQASRLKAQPIVEELKKIISYGADRLNQTEIADRLNLGGFRTSRGGMFTKSSVSAMIKKYGISEYRPKNKSKRVTV